jgi:hypothetical protein
MALIRALAAALALTACASAAVAEEEQLELLGFLHGCWIGTFEGAQELRDERCFQPMLGGRFLRDTHTVVGTGYGGETIYAWNAQAERIEATYYASDGGLMTGRVAAENDGFLWLRDGRYVGPDGRLQHLRSRWIRSGEGGFTVETEREEDGAWVMLMRITYAHAPLRE